MLRVGAEVRFNGPRSEAGSISKKSLFDGFFDSLTMHIIW